MRKLLTLTLVFAALGLHAQKGFKLGMQGGLAIGDFNERVSLTLGVDAGYMYPLGEYFDLGISTGYVHGFADSFHPETLTDKVRYEAVQFVPAALSFRIWPNRNISFGSELGYAFGVGRDFDGGFYFRPIFGILMGAQTELNFSYTGVSDTHGQWGSLNLGVLYTFPPKNPY